MNIPNDPGFGVYIHWPFCQAKCPYCDFNSHVRHTEVDQQRYLAAYKTEIAHMAALSPGRTVTSVFFGGGTPSLMQPQTVSAIIDCIADHWHLPNDAEISLEANPSSVEAERFIGYRKAGVNRLSLGVQALNDKDLKFLGRLHNVAEARAAIELARKTFPRLSFDLIYARPGQSEKQWQEELNAAIDLAADHLSLYQLTIEENTPFWNLRKSGKLIAVKSEPAARLYEITQEVTAARGLPAYEISNHAAPGAECQHNLVYWRYGEYAGIGAGAHGRLNLNDGRHALACERLPEAWLAKVEDGSHAIIDDELLTTEAMGDEFLLMHLRLREGINPTRFEDLSRRPLDPAIIDDLIGYGMIEWIGDNRLRVTSKGWLVLDAVVADLAA